MTWEEFLALPTERAEFVQGRVALMAGVSVVHARVVRFFLALAFSYTARTRAGEVFFDPFLIRLTGPDTGRAPDMIYVAAASLSRLRVNFLEGAPDVALEVVSPDSRRIDRSEKYYEYEAGGVPEYWLIDPERRVAEFYRLGANDRYELVPIVEGVFRSEVMPGFEVVVEDIWKAADGA